MNILAKINFDGAVDIVVTLVLVALVAWVAWIGLDYIESKIASPIPKMAITVARVLMILAAVVFFAYLVFTGQPRVTWFE